MMLLAHREALRFQHEYLDTEHMLLALVSLKSGVAWQVLKRFDVDPRKVRDEVEAILVVRPRPISMGTRLAHTPRYKMAMHFAISEASQMNHGHVGTEHLLLGLLREDTGVAAQILMSQGLKLREVRDEVMKVLGTGIRFMSMRRQRKEIEDLPAHLQAAVAELNDELRRMTSEKERAVAACDFENAARLRDCADKLKRRKQALIRDWMTQHSFDSAWLSWGGGAAFKLAQRINERCRWDALPELADALEQAGCTDAEMLSHCRLASEHSSQCWVVDLLLANATRGR
jgi:hypothetical protein